MDLTLIPKFDRVNKEEIIFTCVGGSHAYGTNTPESDIDVRGIFKTDLKKRLSLFSQTEQISDSKNDITYYEISKFISLAKDCNPNIIELLWTPDDCIQFKNETMQKIIDNRSLFISKKAKHTFSGYAFAQIKKSKGQNKWVNNPKPNLPPKKEDFCWFIPKNHNIILQTKNTCQPLRPIPLKECISIKDQKSINLKDYHCASLEHVNNTFRLYYYGDSAKGVFRNENLVTESIPLDDEFTNLVGLLIYNQQEYEKALKDWKNYWEWKKNRNEDRWKTQEAGEIDYDSKNIMHCIRLLYSGINILKYGEPIVRFEGDRLEFLKSIRKGKFNYEYIMKVADGMMVELEQIYKDSSIQNYVNSESINDLYFDLIGI